ncbi:MAG: response regulator [Armatimonadetes bacterium]|nr:response regulator [Armatimonadota bacterium]
MDNSTNTDKTIVIVDDDPEMIQLATGTLEAKGFRVSHAKSYEEFFQSSGQTNSTTDIFVCEAALFLVSLDLKDGQGLKIVEWLQGCERWADVPITALVSEETLPQVLPASYFGAHEYLVKDIDAQTLSRHVTHTLKGIAPAFGSELPSVTFSLADLLAKEISRAKRTDLPVSLMMCSFVPVPAASHHLRHGMDAQWADRAVEICRRSIRECDTVLSVGRDTFLAILPLTAKPGLSVIETRLHDNLRHHLRAAKTEFGQDIQLVSAGACAPEEAEDWRTFVDLARIRLRVAIEDRCRPSEPRAA